VTYPQGIIVIQTIHKKPFVVIPGQCIGSTQCKAVLEIFSKDVSLKAPLDSLPEVCEARWAISHAAMFKPRVRNTKKTKRFFLNNPAGRQAAIEYVFAQEQAEIRKMFNQFSTVSCHRLRTFEKGMADNDTPLRLSVAKSAISFIENAWQAIDEDLSKEENS